MAPRHADRIDSMYKKPNLVSNQHAISPFQTKKVFPNLFSEFKLWFHHTIILGIFKPSYLIAVNLLTCFHNGCFWEFLSEKYVIRISILGTR